MPLGERSSVLFILLLQVLDIRSGRIDLVRSGHVVRGTRLSNLQMSRRVVGLKSLRLSPFTTGFVRVVFLCAAIEGLHRAII